MSTETTETIPTESTETAETAETTEAAAPPAGTFEAFDFRHPPRLGRAKRVGLEGIFGRFALSTQAFLSSRLRTPSDVVVANIEQSVFSEYVASLGGPCAAIVFELKTERTFPCVLDFGSTFGFYLIDRLLGGSGVGSDVKRRMTPLEQTIIRGIADNVLGRMADAWKEDLPFTATPVGFEAFPEVLGSLCADDSVLVTNIHVDCFKFEGGFSISIPIRALESFLQDAIGTHRLDAVTPEEIAATRRHIETNVRSALLEVDVALPPFSMRAKDVTGLKTGDVIRTGHTTDRPAEVTVNDARRFLGRVGVLNEHMSVRIERVLEPHSAVGSWKPEGVVL